MSDVIAKQLRDYCASADVTDPLYDDVVKLADAYLLSLERDRRVRERCRQIKPSAYVAHSLARAILAELPE